MTLVPRICAAAGALVLLAAAPASAQPQPQGGGGQGTDIASALHLRPDQQAAYQAYLNAGPHPDEIARYRAASNVSALTAPQRLDRIGAALSTQLAVFQRQAQATRAFYGTLSPDQQHTFDQLTAPPRRGGPQG